MAELASVAKLRARLTIARLLDRANDRLYDEGRAAALAMAAHGTRPRIERTQVLRLGAIAEQTGSVSSLLDHIKNQTGKRPEWRQDDFGHRFLVALSDLRQLADPLAGETRSESDEPDDMGRWFHLELCRRFIHHFIAAYVAGPPAQTSPARAGELPRFGTAPRGAPIDRRVVGPTPPRKPLGGRQGRPEQPPPNQDRRTIVGAAATDAPTVVETPAPSREPEAEIVDDNESVGSRASDETTTPRSREETPPSLATATDHQQESTSSPPVVDSADKEPHELAGRQGAPATSEPSLIEAPPSAIMAEGEAKLTPGAVADAPAADVSEPRSGHESEGSPKEEHGVGRND